MGAPNVETPDPVGAGRAQGANEAEQRDSASEGEISKRFATLAALLALKGYALHELAGGGYLISRWDRVASCSDLGQAYSFARRVGAA